METFHEAASFLPCKGLFQRAGPLCRDFLLGFIGPKSEGEEIKQQLREFLREELKLELSEAKTMLTHAKTEAARFLAYEVQTIQDDIKHAV